MKGFDTTPKPEFLRAMQNQKWTVAGALSELVDNGFGPGRGNARTVHITHDTAKRIISVLDDGRGMEAIGRLFQLGNTIGRTPGDIGLYGSGGTMAILWLASRVEVWTLKDGHISHDEVDWRSQIAAGAFPVVSDEWKKANLSNTPAELLAVKHGTLIKLHLQRERTFVPSNVQRDLAQTYAPALRMGRTLMWTTIGKGGETRQLADPFPVPEDYERAVDFNVTVAVRDEHLHVHGRIGMIEGLPQSRSQVAVGYGPRVIMRTRDCYSSLDGSQKYVGTGIGGWLDLGEGWQPYLATTKDAMNDQGAWDVLMDYVFGRIKSLLEQVEHEELRLVFDDIGLMLEQALDGKFHVEVSRDGKKRVAEHGETTVGQRQGTDTPDQERDPTVPAQLDPGDQEGDQTTSEQPAETQLLIVEQSDAEMEEALCRVLTSKDDLIVTVNKDHEAIQEALKAKPVNRMALYLLVTREMAQVLAGEDHLLNMMFPLRFRKRLEEMQEPDRPRLIARQLMDRVRKIPA